MDRRVQKTRSLLHQALGSLILEKSYETITLKEILDRANVGRSTFYMHFRDKDELLVSSIQGMLRAGQPARPPSSARRDERVLWFSLRLLEHIHHHQNMSEVRMGARGRAIIHDHLRSVLAEMIADEVDKCLDSCRSKPSHVSPTLLAHFIASTFVLVLDWWVDTRSALRPNEINAAFQALVLPTLTAIYD
jgi:AcrR family transcriptional regulator